MTDWGTLLTAGFVISILSTIIIVICGSAILLIDSIYNYPTAAEEAKEDCIEREFDNFDTFERIPFTEKSLGVKCKYESKYVLEDGSPIIVGKK